MRIRLALMAIVGAFVAAALAIPLALSSTTKTPFNGNLCTVVSAGSLSTLKITDPCIHTAVSKTVSTPIGSVQETSYQARWGTGGSISNPQPRLQIGAITVKSGPPAAIAYAASAFRQQVLANGAPFSSRPLATEVGDTLTCHNPPIDDCTEAEIMELVGQSGVTIVYRAPAIFIAADDPQKPSVGEANDRKQEKAIEAPFESLGRGVMAAF